MGNRVDVLVKDRMVPMEYDLSRVTRQVAQAAIAEMCAQGCHLSYDFCIIR